MRQIKFGRNITDRSNETLNKYLLEVGQKSMVSIDEEVTLAQDIRKGGPEGERAKERLVTANLRFVISVAKQYMHQGLALNDLIEEGNIGLIKAAEKFDETRGFKFVSYAVWWIRQSIKQAIDQQSRIVRLPLNQVGAVSKINQVKADFVQLHHRQPSTEELAEILDMDEVKILQSLIADSRPQSIDAPLSDDTTSVMSDTLTSGDEDRADRESDRLSMATDLQSVLHAVLKPRERQIVAESFGVGCSERSLEEIGTDMNLSRERVRQIREKSIEKIRCSGQAHLLLKYLG